MNKPPLILLVSALDHPLVGVLESAFEVAHVPSGGLAVEQSSGLEPDVVVLEEHLVDGSPFETSLALISEQQVPLNVPILVAVKRRATPAQRVAAVKSGVWDFVRCSDDGEEIILRLKAFVRAKRNLDMAIKDGHTDARSGLHTLNGLARRARQLGALMARERAGMACLVLAIDGDATDPFVGSLVARAARVSDVVGAVGDREIAIIAPGTDKDGVRHLARRVVTALNDARERGAGTAVLSAGYDAVANLSYTPVDPIELIQRAAMAVHAGTPEREMAWLRRYEAPLLANGVR